MGKKRRKITWRVDDNGCWICTSHAHNGRGYPMVCNGYRQLKISRFLYEELFGVLDDKIVVRHKCDNTYCINPEHLESGTQADNNRDTSERGRFNRKLTIQDVLNIRKSNVYRAELARMYSVSPSTITEIKERKTWKYI